jgi:hypothetical protein
MTTLSTAQRRMLRDIARDGEPTDFADFAYRANNSGGLGWHNRERVLDALQRKGLIDDDLALTPAGKEVLA